MSIKDLPKDKIKHIVGCLALTLAIGYLSPLNSINSAAAAFLVAFIKEVVWDLWLKRGTFDEKDMAANLIGCMAGLVALESGTLASMAGG
jgi:hypothetical protein